MELTPLMQLDVKETDTPAIIKRAKAIASEHIYYIGQSMGEPARFATYATEAEKQANKNPRNLYIRVEENSVFNTFRFNASLKAAREEAKQKKK